MKKNTTVPLTKKDFTWTTWTPAHIRKIGEEYITLKKETIESIKFVSKKDRTFENTILPFEILSRFSSRNISPLGLLTSLSPKKSIRQISEETLNTISAQSIDILYDAELYKALLEYKPKKSDLNVSDYILYTDTIKSFKRMGFDLSESDQKKLKKMKKELSVLGSAFDTANNEYKDHILVTKRQLDGLPETYIKSLSKKDGKYVVTLEYPHLFPFLNYAHDEKQRQKLAEKKSKHGGKSNLKRLEKIVSLRKDIASLLGYSHHADYVLENRMAKNSTTVSRFLHSLEKKTKESGLKDIQTLKKLKKKDSKNPLGSHDIGYYINKDLSEKLSIDHEMIREYFPLEHVTNEIFSLFETLFGVVVKKHSLPTWHKDVTTYVIIDSKTKEKVGYFALDLFPRDGKFGHAAVSNTYDGWIDEKGRHPGYSVMMANYRKPSASTPCLLSHDEVVTFLHEFGHLLHGTLSKTKYASQFGTSVAWDFVELPSQLMENWIWEPKFLTSFSSHYKTKESLPKETIDNLIKSKKHFSAYGTRRQLALGLFDITMHTNFKKSIKKIYDDSIKQIGGIQPSASSLMPAGFGHMVGYDAGYYSYMWALVFAYDVFSEFKKKGITNKTLGRRLRKEILEVGSSRDEMETLKIFLNRKPSDTSFIRSISK